MKIEVFNPSSSKIIETYSVPNLSLLDFKDQEWLNEGKIEIDLNDFSNTMKNFNIEESEPSQEAVDFYLPDSITESLLSQVAIMQTDIKENNHFTDRYNEICEISVHPILKKDVILSSVVSEILRNHHICSDLRVRISDG